MYRSYVNKPATKPEKKLLTGVRPETKLKITYSGVVTDVINDPAKSVGDLRVIDGKVNTFEAKLFDGDWYFTPDDIKTALGIDAMATLEGYTNLRTVAKTKNVSYEYNGILNTATAW